MIPFRVALIVVVPSDNAVAKPFALMLTAAGFEELQLAMLVRFCWLLSLKVPVAVNCNVPFISSDWFAGVTAMLVSTAEVTVRGAELLKDSNLAAIVD